MSLVSELPWTIGSGRIRAGPVGDSENALRERRQRLDRSGRQTQGLPHQGAEQQTATASQVVRVLFQLLSIEKSLYHYFWELR